MKAKKILVVEDNSKSMRLLRMLLTRNGYQVLEAVDGHTALTVALENFPDLIVMDIQLPGISGLEVTRKLRDIDGFQKIPIIALTAHAMKGEREQFLDSGCTDYISKPIDTRMLPKQIEYWLNKKQ